MSKLPLELITKICEVLRADHESLSPDIASPSSQCKAALDACSLVCWSWHSIAQEHLFHNITYSYRERPAETHEVAACMDEERGRWSVFEWRGGRREMMPRKSFAMFVAFLDQHPHIRPYIRCLDLVCYVKPLVNNSGVWKWEFQPEATDDPVSFTDFTRLLQLLPRLQYLKLDDFTIDHAVNEYEFGEHIKLQYLNLTWSTYLRTAYDLAIVLRCFSSIAYLRLNNFKLVLGIGPALWPSFHARSSVDVQSLCVFDAGSDADQLNELVFACKSLRRLDMSLRDNLAPPTLAPILAHVGSTLQELHIVFPSAAVWGYQDATFIDLSSCTHLHTVTLGVPLLSFFYSYTFTIECYYRALSELQRTLQSISGPLHNFTLNIGIYAEPNCPREERHAYTIPGCLSALDMSLRDLARQHGLRRVSVEYFNSVPWEELRELFLAAFSSLAQAGLLNLTLLEMDPKAPELYDHWAWGLR